MTTLRELEAVAYELSNRRTDDLDALRRWLAVLVAPGASLGGAKPKANFEQTDGSLWIAKFPARDDDRNTAAWGVCRSPTGPKGRRGCIARELIKLGNSFHTFCVKRFDRTHGTRRFYASAMTLLRKTQSEARVP